MSDIYNQHDKAFAGVSAYVILKDGERVATVAFKLPRDGAGRIWAYVHWLGSPMVRGFAGGGGYDKRTAACAMAARKIPDVPFLTAMNAGEGEGLSDREAFLIAMRADAGAHWDGALNKAGFTVFQAV